MFARSVVAAFVAVPFVAQVAFAASCTRQYTVKEGDWCDTISAANNASTYQLAVVNAAINNVCSNLQVGQTLCLGTEGEDCKNTHVVRADDSCDLLTGTYNINATLLHTNNPQIDGDCTNLYIGEVLCVANSVIVPAVPEGSPAPAISIPATVIPAAQTSTSAAPSATPTAEDDDDEENWPYCDEL